MTIRPRAAVAVAAAVVASLALGACDAAAPGAPPAIAPSAPSAPPLPDERDFLAQIDRTRGTKDCFTPLRDPPFVAAGDAPFMQDAEMVLGLAVRTAAGTESVCYPVQYLNAHEIVEHRFAGLELLACW